MFYVVLKKFSIDDISDNFVFISSVITYTIPYLDKVQNLNYWNQHLLFSKDKWKVTKK